MAEQEKFEKKELTKKSKNFARWYTDVVLKAELADYAPVRGFMVIRPYGYAIWKIMKETLDKTIQQTKIAGKNHEELYFPLFIPMRLLQKEKEHVEGFSPQLAVVTYGGGEKLVEPLAVRPTSETIIYEKYKDWISSWRDLPLLYYTWNNVVRWEKRTYLFLRTTEFLWHEGHTVHVTQREAMEEVIAILRLYENFLKKYLAMPLIIGQKSASEKFAGAKDTYTLECLMSDKKALQAGTSHHLGQNFSKPFNIKFQDEKGKLQYVWQTCWAVTTRLIGALVMVHGDDNGLILPPKVAPTQVVIIPIPARKEWGREGCKVTQRKAIVHLCVKYAKKVAEMLRKEGVRVKLDDRTQYSPGFKFNEWELKGAPLRIEVGEDEVRGNYLTIVKRDDNSKLKVRFSTPHTGEKTSDAVASSSKLQLKVQNLLEEVQKELYQKAKKFLEKNTYTADDYSQFKKIMKERRGFIRAFWCGKKECEEKIKEETKASNRLLPLSAKKENGRCIYCGKPSSFRWYFAQAY